MDLVEPDFRRARSPAQKEQRREAILAAARTLADAGGVRDVSLGDIARHVGLAKSNVVRYFGTREEIFLHLTADGWGRWAGDVTAGLEDVEQGSGEGVAAVLAGRLAARPLFGDLLAQTATNLEHNVSRAAARAFKLTTLTILGELGDHVAAVVGDLTPGEGRDVVAVTVMAATALWPVAHPPAVLAALYADDPAVAAACIDFEPTLQRVVATFVAGVRARGEG